MGSAAHLNDRVDSLSVAQKHLLELAKALVMKPKLLILDEPTAPLGQESVDLLFARVRTAAEAGTAVVYITHRLAEVRVLADRVTVLRDGRPRGTADVADITDDELLALDRRTTARLDIPAEARGRSRRRLPRDHQLDRRPGFTRRVCHRQLGGDHRRRRSRRQRAERLAVGAGRSQVFHRGGAAPRDRASSERAPNGRPRTCPRTVTARVS